jgi:hypothetical protein
MINKSMLDTTALAKGHEDLKRIVLVKNSLLSLGKACYKKWAHRFGTQKCAERAVEAVDAVHAVRILLRQI